MLTQYICRKPQTLPRCHLSHDLVNDMLRYADRGYWILTRMDAVDQALLQTIGVVVVTATAAVLVARFFQVPAIVAYLITGVLLGPVLSVLPADQVGGHGSDLSLIAELGIVLLLFLVGLELSLAKIRDVGKVAIAAGIGQVVFTAVGGTLFALVLGFTWVESVFVAVALTFSSTVVVVKVLDQKGELNSLYGRIAVGIFLVQDMVVIVVLTVLAGLGSAESMTPWNVGLGIARAFGGMLLLLALVLFASRYLLSVPFNWIARSPRGLVVWSLGWCTGLVVLAHALGLSPEIGAFLAGMSLAQLPCSEDLRRRVHPLMNFFVAIFFVTLGVQMQFGEAANHWLAAVVLSLFVLIGNPFIFMWIIARFGYGQRTCFYTSVTVAQISEFSFVFAAVGLNAGLIDESILSLIAVVGLVTIIASVYMMLYNHVLYRWADGARLLRFFKAKQADDDDPGGPLKTHAAGGHIIVVGMNGLGLEIVRRLHETGHDVLAIDTDPHKLAGLPCRTMVGNIDYLSVLHETGLPHAKLAISALKIEDTNNLLVYRCKTMGVPVVAHAFDRALMPVLMGLGASYAMDSKTLADARIEQLLQEQGVLSP